MSMYAVVDPATGETLKEYPTITDDELRDAIARADRAHREWSRAATVADRASLVRRVGELHSERRKELAEIIGAEMGKPVRQARGEVDFCASIYGFYADNAEALMADEPIELLGGEGSAVVRRSSLGVLLGIMPWNFPYYQVARFAAPNLIIGNFVLKDPGQFRFAFDINYNGTPGDPSDDIEVPDSFRVVRASTGNSDLSGRDFCADLVEFTS